MANKLVQKFYEAFNSSEATQVLQEAGATNIRLTDSGIAFDMPSGGNLETLLLRPYREQRRGYTRKDGTQVRSHVVNHGAPTTDKMLEAHAKDEATSTKIGETTIASFIDTALKNLTEIRV